ncbi:MAG: dipeptidase [Fidelibacterota bacterium]|nr:MAG: dipeptidase [Candidatus Neomarinimicrobiota bacterium]
MRPEHAGIIALTILTLGLGTGPDSHVPTTKPDAALLEEVREILKEVPLIDGHNDAPWQIRKLVRNHLDDIDFSKDTRRFADPMQTDIPRLRAGGVGGQFWSVWVPDEYENTDALQLTFEQIDLVHRLVARYPDHLELALTADDVDRIHGNGKIASLIGMEGGHCINNSLAVLRQFYHAGARSMTITHWDNNDWADAATVPPVNNGLTSFGREVIKEMNRLGMLIDLSHISLKTMHDVLDVSKAPVIFSHSSARAVCDHPRNVSDEVLKRVKRNGGMVMVTFVTSYVSEEMRYYKADEQAERRRLEELHPDNPTAVKAGMSDWVAEHPVPTVPLALVADHVDHIKDVAGIDHVGIGSDFDGIATTPEGLEDVSGFPNLLAELLKRGYAEEDLKKVAGLNLLRVYREVENRARKLQRNTKPADVLIDEIDER